MPIKEYLALAKNAEKILLLQICDKRQRNFFSLKSISPSAPKNVYAQFIACDIHKNQSLVRLCQHKYKFYNKTKCIVAWWQ